MSMRCTTTASGTTNVQRFSAAALAVQQQHLAVVVSEPRHNSAVQVFDARIAVGCVFGRRTQRRHVERKVGNDLIRRRPYRALGPQPLAHDLDKLDLTRGHSESDASQLCMISRNTGNSEPTMQRNGSLF